MHNRLITFAKLSILAMVAIGVALGCVGGNPYLAAASTTPAGSGTGGGGTTGGGGDEPGGGGSAGGVTPYIAIGIRNRTLQQIHYYLHLFAFTGPDGAVTDTLYADYINAGYQNAGESITLGSVTISAPAGEDVLWYFHEAGAFPESSVRPATFVPFATPPDNIIATYDVFFNATGATVLTPDLILFYSGEFEADLCDLRVAGLTDSTGAFQIDTLNPVETQGTGCNCFGQVDPFQVLGPATRSPDAALCNEYLAASSIIYEFRDSDPSGRPERLLWQVTRGGEEVHEFAW